MRRLLASCAGLGHVPRLWGGDSGGGTIASLVALAPAVALGGLGTVAQIAGAALITVLALWSAVPFADDDPAWVVIDEVAGMFVAVIGLRVWPAWLAAFAVFRLADATKRAPGVAAAERLPGTWGVTGDDVVAGVWGLAAGWLVQLIAG